MRVKLLTKFHSSQILLNAPVLIESVEYQFTFFQNWPKNGLGQF